MKCHEQKCKYHCKHGGNSESLCSQYSDNEWSRKITEKRPVNVEFVRCHLLYSITGLSLLIMLLTDDLFFVNKCSQVLYESK